MGIGERPSLSPLVMSGHENILPAGFPVIFFPPENKNEDVYVPSQETNPIPMMLVQVPENGAKSGLKKAADFIKDGNVDKPISELEEVVRKNPDDASSHFNLGRLYFQQGRMNESLLQLKRAWQLDKKVPGLASTLADVLAQMGKGVEAIECLNEALSNDPLNGELFFRRVKLKLNEGRLDDVKEELGTFLSREPASFEAHKLMGLAAYRSGDKGTARREWEVALKVEPRDTDTVLWLGGNLIETGLADAAIAVFRRLTRLNPINPESHYYLGIAYLEKGDNQGAVAAFNKAIGLNKKHWDSQNALGIALWRINQKEKAVSKWEEIASENPADDRSRTNLGIAYCASDRFEDAERVLREAVSINASNVAAMVNLGVMLARKDDRKGAIEQWEAAIKANPENVPAHLNLGYELYWMGKVKESIGELKKALGLQVAKDPDALVVLALALNQEGNRKDALDNIRRAISIKPDDADAHYWLGFMHNTGGELQEGVEALERSLALNPKNAAAHDLLAGYLFRQKKYDAAVSHWKTALQLDPSDSTMRAKYASALLQNKDYSGAVFSLQQAIRLNPSNGRPYSVLGEALWNMGRKDEAQKAWEEGLKKDPTEWRAALYISRSMVHQGDYLGALQRAKSTLKKDPGNQNIVKEVETIENEWWREKIRMQDRGYLEQELPNNEEAIIIIKGSPRLSRVVAMRLLLDGRPDIAITYFETASSKYDDSHFYHEWGRALHALGRYDEAIAIYNNARGKDPDNKEIQAHLDLARKAKERARKKHFNVDNPCKWIGLKLVCEW